MEKKITGGIYISKPNKVWKQRNSVVRIKPHTMDLVRETVAKTNVPIGKLVSKCVEYALKNMEIDNGGGESDGEKIIQR